MTLQGYPEQIIHTAETLGRGDSDIPPEVLKECYPGRVKVCGWNPDEMKGESEVSWAEFKSSGQAREYIEETYGDEDRVYSERCIALIGVGNTYWVVERREIREIPYESVRGPMSSEGPVAEENVVVERAFVFEDSAWVRVKSPDHNPYPIYFKRDEGGQLVLRCPEVLAAFREELRLIGIGDLDQFLADAVGLVKIDDQSNGPVFLKES